MSKEFIFFRTSYPPTINTYYGTSGKRRFIQKRGQEYRKEIQELWDKGDKVGITGQAIIGIRLYPGDKRKRDWDNIIKPLQDALMHAGVIEDDSNVIVGMVQKMPPIKGEGYAQIFILAADDKNVRLFSELFSDLVVDLGWQKPPQVQSHHTPENTDA